MFGGLENSLYLCLRISDETLWHRKSPSQLNGVFGKITLVVAFCFAPKVTRMIEYSKGFIGNFLINLLFVKIVYAGAAAIHSR
jgi:hypothetical protein